MAPTTSMEFGQSRIAGARVPASARPRFRGHRDYSARALFFGLMMGGLATTYLAGAGAIGSNAVVTVAAAADGAINKRATIIGRSVQQKDRCLSRQEQRARVAARAAIPLRKAVRSVKGRGDLIRARLCEREGRLLYLLTILGRGGKVFRVAVDARTGLQVGVPP